MKLTVGGGDGERAAIETLWAEDGGLEGEELRQETFSPGGQESLPERGPHL